MSPLSGGGGGPNMNTTMTMRFLGSAAGSGLGSGLMGSQLSEVVLVLEPSGLSFTLRRVYIDVSFSFRWAFGGRVG